MGETVEVLCRRYTDLSKEEIAQISQLAGRLQYWADMKQVDAFINCQCRNGRDSVVVAQAGPQEGSSAYRNSVVGLLSKPANEPAVARTFQLGCMTRRMRAINQECVPVIQVAAPILRKERVIGVLTYERAMDQEDGTDPLLENFQDVLQRETYIHTETDVDGNWFWLAEYLDEALMVVDKQGFVAYRNTCAKKLYERLGYLEDVLGQQYKNVSLVDLPQGRPAAPVEAEIGKYILSVRQVKIQRPEVAHVVIVKDITNQKATERELILKSVVVREMHHRVKNNLQTISSLLRLQMSRTKNEETKQALTETNSRILAIASTHQLLAQNGVEQVRLREVLENIQSNALRSSSPAQTNVQVKIRGGGFQVDSDVATSVALVTNELLQNSLRHAFVGRTEGKIEIIVRAEQLYGVIMVKDNGIGFDNSQTRHLGLNIVQSLVREKLKGYLEILSDPKGTCVTFDFQL